MKNQKAENAMTEALEINEQTEITDAGDAAGMENTMQKTKAFSERLNRMTKKAVDDFIAEMGLLDDDGEAVTTRERYDEIVPILVKRDEEERLALVNEIAELKEELFALKLERQDEEMMEDPVRGEAYIAMRDDVLALVDYCRENGHAEVDIPAAFEALFAKNGGEIMKTMQKKAQDKAMRYVNEQKRSRVGRLSSGEENAKTDYKTMSDEEFARHLEMAKRGALRQR
ncbi:MAG: hypothetical protein IKL92_01065 [Oscillospiraceae bacterium]|nr:hypothetical protein [Oscillospiraceae bacterium]